MMRADQENLNVECEIFESEVRFPSVTYVYIVDWSL